MDFILGDECDEFGEAPNKRLEVGIVMTLGLGLGKELTANSYWLLA